MTLISTSELAALQEVAESGLQSDVYISRKTVNREAADGWSETWVEDTTPVLGWLYEFTPGGATIGVVSGQMGLTEGLWLRLPVGTSISSGDKARLGTAYYIVEHTNDESLYKAWLVCAVRRVV